MAFTQSVLWDITEQEFSATQTKQLYDAVASIEVSYIDEEGEKQVVKTYTKNNGLLKMKANGTATATGYANWANLGFTLDAADYKEGEYNVLIKFMNAEGTTVIYSAAATLNVNNPELGATYVKLVPGFVDENGVYQITGTPTELSTANISLNDVKDVVMYNLKDALILGKGAAIKEIIDLDNAEYAEEGREDEAFEMHNLVKVDNKNNTWNLVVNQWAYEWETLVPKWRSDIYNQLYQTRNIRAMISLFGNEDNVVPFDFQVEVKSELYTETVADAVTFDAAKLAIEFGAQNVTGTAADESVIDIKAAITKAIVQAGTDKNKTYTLFATTKSVAAGDAVTTVYNYSSPKSAGGLLLKGDNIVKLTKVEYLKMCDAFGVAADSKYDDENKYELTVNDWTAIWGIAQLFYNEDGSAKYRDVNNDGKIDKNDYLADTNGDGKNDSPVFVQNGRPDYNTSLSWGTDYTAKMAIYTAFVTKVDFNTIVAGKPDSGATQIVRRDSRIASLEITFDEPAVAKNYFQNVNTTGVVFKDVDGYNHGAITIKPVAEAPNSVTGGQVKVGMTLTIRDAWGMIMEIPFEVTVKTAK